MNVRTNIFRLGLILGLPIFSLLVAGCDTRPTVIVDAETTLIEVENSGVSRDELAALEKEIFRKAAPGGVGAPGAATGGGFSFSTSAATGGVSGFSFSTSATTGGTSGFSFSTGATTTAEFVPVKIIVVEEEPVAPSPSESKPSEPSISKTSATPPADSLVSSTQESFFF